MDSADHSGQVLTRLQLVDLAGSECAGEQGPEIFPGVKVSVSKGQHNGGVNCEPTLDPLPSDGPEAELFPLWSMPRGTAVSG